MTSNRDCGGEKKPKVAPFRIGKPRFRPGNQRKSTSRPYEASCGENAGPTRFCRGAHLRSLILLISVMLSFQSIAPAVNAQPAGVPPGGFGPTEVGVIALEVQEVPFTVTVPGRAVAFEQVDIRPRVSGIISEIVYQPGWDVAVGDILFRIEADTYTAEVASAEAEVARAEAAAANADATVARYEELEGTGVTTEQLESAKVSVLQAQAELSSARAALQVARLNLERTDIKSPIEGVAAIPSVSVGALVTENQSNALTTVTRINPIYVDVEESSQRIAEVRARIDAGSLNPGENLDIRLRLENGEEYASQGQMVSPGTSVSETTGTQAFRLRFDNPYRQILPGQFLRVDLSLGTMEAVLVPQGATSRASTGELTAFVVSEGKAEQRTLVEEGSYQNAWVVTDGVEAGEQLIVDGLGTIRNGADVSTVAVTISEDGVATAADGRSEEFERPADLPAGGPPGMPPAGAMPGAAPDDAPAEGTSGDEG